MNSELKSQILLAKRPELSRYVVALIGIQFLAILTMASLLPAVEQGWINAAIGFVVFLVSYYFAFQDYSDRLLSFVLSLCLILIASIVVNATAATSLVFGGHYGQIFSLGVIAFYRNRRLMAAATFASLIEQVLRCVLIPDSVFAATPLRNELMIDHICWLAGSGVVFTFICQAGQTEAHGLISVPSAPVQAPLAALERKSEPAAAAAASALSTTKPLASVISTSTSGAQEAVSPQAPLSVEELVKVATEVGVRAKKLNRSITNLEGPLKRMVQSINGANRGMQEIKDELSRTAASVIQITLSSEMHANKANEVFQAADEAAYGSQIGAQSTEQSIINMDQIREQMDSIAQRMDNLLTKSQKMVQVVGFADELALQSKVLSVNAAIEAAKAGDRGQGFTAVATEVKSLANQSKEATREVRQILKEIQKSIADVRRSIALGNETVELASDQCRSTAESIRGLDSSVSSSRDAAETIMVSSKDQVQGIMQISHAMNDIQTVSEQNSGSLSNLQVEAQKLNIIARDLVSDMGGYQTLIDQLLSNCAGLNQQDSTDQA